MQNSCRIVVWSHAMLIHPKAQRPTHATHQAEQPSPEKQTLRRQFECSPDWPARGGLQTDADQLGCCCQRLGKQGGTLRGRMVAESSSGPLSRSYTPRPEAPQSQRTKPQQSREEKPIQMRQVDNPTRPNSAAAAKGANGTR